MNKTAADDNVLLLLQLAALPLATPPVPWLNHPGGRAAGEQGQPDAVPRAGN